ncbi:hypothetical protein IC575_018215 [Cucumis melo]
MDTSCILSYEHIRYLYAVCIHFLFANITIQQKLFLFLSAKTGLQNLFVHNI